MTKAPTRAFAVALAIATQRLIFILSLLVVGDPTYGQVVTLSVAAWSAALVVHSSLAEVWIRLTRNRGVPTANPLGTASEAMPGSR